MTTSTTTAVTQLTVPRRGRRWIKYTAALILVLLAWAGFDLYAPRRASMREFDADEVARLETAMWRSYYSRQRVKLFRELAELLRTQYRLPPLRSNAVAYRAARAAFVFKEGRTRADYERALPDLVSFYQSVRAVSDTDFDVERAARLELEWWVVHRERRRHAPGDLDRALADLQAEIFRVPAERFTEHARLRAEAMEIRDTKADRGGVTE
jgi:hypothetical protein